MSKHKNFLEVERKSEPYIFDICKELELHGKTVVDTSECNWESISRRWGVKTKPLVESTIRGKPEPLLYPIARTKNNRKNSLALIQIPNGVQVIEEKKETKSKFRFLRRN